ncbi:AlbA family DNA-binding domain-containing protein [Methylomonas rivi]|uniref:ATP-binding protein n=1 Tax=Methylomonas rivi TaxID=2952226 RepID=A0ABT1U1V5_9GAMM|nr:ATP-binding protein [Methylomonas sp. WSC-6]MCQ8127808.1 ATP-binding protein [Methylomonas sp. WSC-6]
MLNYSFYPFNKALEDIDGSDLSLLRKISEGWYIDYKVQGLKIVDYGKHLCAFANQYGGWLIIGVSEKNDGSRSADEFLGVEKSNVEKITLEIREAASSHVNPEILYEEKVIDGPLEEIGLVEGKSIIVIGIPRSFNTPHIHSSGRIYRRLADQSKPKEETDRYILDELWKRGNEHREKTIKRLTQIPELPKSQSSQPWVHIYFKPSEWQLSPEKKLSFDEFVRIVTNSDNSVVGVHAPMTAVHSAVNGFVARQIANNDPSLATLTFRWWHDGVVRFDVPLNLYDFSGFQETHEKNIYAKQFCRIAYERRYENMNIVDYSIFPQVLAALTNCYLHMLKAIGDNRDVYSCFTLINIFHTSPYVDSKGFIERIESYSLPLTMDCEIVFPKEPTEDSMLIHQAALRDADCSDRETYQSVPYVFCGSIIYNIFTCVGLVSDINVFEDTEMLGFSKVNNLT